jgi:hypothetical protein
VWAEVIGGGGSGGRESTYGAAGGTAGARITQQLTVTPAASITVTIGAGGAARTVDGNNGLSGASSVFGSITALGGNGGATNQAVNTTDVGALGQSCYGVGGGVATDAPANSGAGGGGGRTRGGAGGSGIIIVKLLA